jgi:hypothetical protein
MGGFPAPFGIVREVHRLDNFLRARGPSGWNSRICCLNRQAMPFRTAVAGPFELTM